MCGIMGYAGRQDALPLVLEGLRRLEYRGYDSAGVAVLVEPAPPGDALPGVNGAAGGHVGGTRTALLERTRPQAKVVLRRAPGKLDHLVAAVAAESAAGA